MRQKIKKHVTKTAKNVHAQSFLQEKPFKYILMAVGVIVFVNLAFVFTHLKTDVISQPVKYNYLFGIVKTGSWTSSFLLPTLLLLIVILNILAAEYFYRKDKFLTYIFLGINFFLGIISFLEIIALNSRGS